MKEWKNTTTMKKNKKYEAVVFNIVVVYIVLSPRLICIISARFKRKNTPDNRILMSIVRVYHNTKRLKKIIMKT